MPWWIWLIIGLFIVWVLLRIDWSMLSDEDSTFGEKLKAIGDACCLGTIFKKK